MFFYAFGIETDERNVRNFVIRNRKEVIPENSIQQRSVAIPVPGQNSSKNESIQAPEDDDVAKCSFSFDTFNDSN